MRYGSEPLFLFNCGSDLNPYVGSLDCFVAGFDDAHKSDRFVVRRFDFACFEEVAHFFYEGGEGVAHLRNDNGSAVFVVDGHIEVDACPAVMSHDCTSVAFKFDYHAFIFAGADGHEAFDLAAHENDDGLKLMDCVGIEIAGTAAAYEADAVLVEALELVSEAECRGGEKGSMMLVGKCNDILSNLFGERMSYRHRLSCRFSEASGRDPSVFRGYREKGR